MDEAFYAENEANFDSHQPQSPRESVDLLEKSTSITYLNHGSRTIRLKNPDGSDTRFSVFGSPYSLAQGNWAFQYTPERAQDLWDKIPLATDILITHTPPKFHCDESKHMEPAGCEGLRRALWRVRPLLSICGHVHEARGAELVTWDLDCPNISFKEMSTTYWVDPSEGSKKQALLDLSARGGEPIDWSGGQFECSEPTKPSTSAAGPRLSKLKIKAMTSSRFGSPKSGQTAPVSLTPSTAGSKESVSSQDVTKANPESKAQKAGSAIRGRGGSPTSGRSDGEALAGRVGRKQTCVINAAIMATSWPYKGSGGERYNKPIVVDVDLPVWSGSADLEG